MLTGRLFGRLQQVLLLVIAGHMVGNDDGAGWQIYCRPSDLKDAGSGQIGKMGYKNNALAKVLGRIVIDSVGHQFDIGVEGFFVGLGYGMGDTWEWGEEEEEYEVEGIGNMLDGHDLQRKCRGLRIDSQTSNTSWDLSYWGT